MDQNKIHCSIYAVCHREMKQSCPPRFSLVGRNNVIHTVMHESSQGVGHYLQVTSRADVRLTNRILSLWKSLQHSSHTRVRTCAASRRASSKRVNSLSGSACGRGGGGRCPPAARCVPAAQGSCPLGPGSCPGGFASNTLTIA